MKSDRLLSQLICFVLLSVAASKVTAAVVTFGYSGEVTASSLTYAGLNGAPVSGTISFDDSLVDSPFSTGITRSDTFTTQTAANEPFRGSFQATMQVGAFDFSTQLDASSSGYAFVQTTSDTVDSVRYSIVPQVGSGREYFNMQQSGVDMLNPGSGGLSGTTAEAIAFYSLAGRDFGTLSFNVGQWNGWDGTRFLGYVYFEVTSFSAVPIPATLPLLLSGLLGFLAWRKSASRLGDLR